MTRVAVFIDYQNVYMRGREVFASPSAPFVEGQVNPLRLGKLLTERGRSEDPKRLLAAVHIFRGEPSSAHAPKAQAACQRQVQHWASLESVRPVTRPLQYRVMGFQDGGEARRGCSVEASAGIRKAVVIARDVVPLPRARRLRTARRSHRLHEGLDRPLIQRRQRVRHSWVAVASATHCRPATTRERGDVGCRACSPPMLSPRFR